MNKKCDKNYQPDFDLFAYNTYISFCIHLHFSLLCDDVCANNLHIIEHKQSIDNICPVKYVFFKVNISFFFKELFQIIITISSSNFSHFE